MDGSRLFNAMRCMNKNRFLIFMKASRAFLVPRFNLRIWGVVIAQINITISYRNRGIWRKSATVADSSSAMRKVGNPCTDTPIGVPKSKKFAVCDNSFSDQINLSKEATELSHLVSRFVVFGQKPNTANRSNEFNSRLPSFARLKRHKKSAIVKTMAPLFPTLAGEVW